MLLSIQEKYNDNILLEILKRYDVEKEKVIFIGGFDSYVYEFSKNDNDYILKITHSFRRSANYILGEIDWLNFMADKGLAVARAIPSIFGNFVETFGDNEAYFISILYEKAPGHLPTEADWNSSLFEEWGRITGKLHAVTKTYKSKNPTSKRNEWIDEEHLNIEKYIPSDQSIVIQKSKDLLERLKKITPGTENYGLIHGDLHFLNFTVEDGRITLFDFDDIAYNYFANDIAVILFYTYWRPLKQSDCKKSFINEFLSSFLKGYNQENHFQEEWFSQLQDFLRLRHLVQYIAFLQSVDIASLDNDEIAFMRHMEKVIEQNYLIVDFDFEMFSKQLPLNKRVR
ncbi:phosphotransferase enzyme family protein [uncultured Brevibacillus sp.]|uniref:phosphotransferase enzyme family protein n=1 Tax=uncultured Brevibacillus sp. TaxID=169970 RepID=UPI002597F386|nr:phosphotransferase [uncultured Brevibacillus sp.]